jgi:hypothetical protein
MSHRGRILVAAILALVGALAAQAQDKKDGGDQTQSFDSPLPLVGGATLQVAKDKTSVAFALAGQKKMAVFNYWQIGFSGTANADGEADVYSEAEGVTPGVKAKIGFGYSSFLAEDTSARDDQMDEFMANVRCISMVVAARKQLPEKYRPTIPKEDAVTDCGALIEVLEPKTAEAKGAGEIKDDAQKQFDLVFKTLKVASKPAVTFESMDSACEELKNVTYAYRYCDGSGKKIGTPEDLGARYKQLYAKIVTIGEKSLRYRVSLNWTPAMTGIEYKPLVEGKPDLSAQEKWVGFLNGGSIDFTVHHRALILGLQAGFADKLDEKATTPVDVCKVTTQGEYYFEKCKAAALGKPSPFSKVAYGGVLAIDPLLPSLSDSAFRPGLQINGKRETLQNDKYRWVLSGSLYVARIDAPMKLVVGIRPTYTWLRGTDKKDDFKVAVFIGVRP